EQPKFLYVEDDPMSREIMKFLLTRMMKFPDLTIFDNSQDFLDKLRMLPHIPNVIFLDIQMSHHDGYELLQMLRAEPTYQQSKVVAMTANVMATDVQGLRKVGFDGLIGKPILKDIFPDLIKRILDGESVWFVP
ncbi:MAG TPA: response regulator, partial [Aggregatilineales bacterium]|nr:response regulator [Aggregatilineales bacterium]